MRFLQFLRERLRIRKYKVDIRIPRINIELSTHRIVNPITFAEVLSKERKFFSILSWVQTLGQMRFFAVSERTADNP